jgi:CDP-glucose 4,6-dehydratase
MQSVLVTGGNGFCGASLMKRLLDTRPDVRVVTIVKDRNFKSRRDILDRVSVVYGDICDIKTVQYALSHYEIDTIFHLAAVTILRQSVVDPITCYNSNVIGTLNILEASRQQKIKKVVFKSSDKAYGTYENLPYIETMPVQASPDAYSTSKACADLIAQQYATGYDLNVSIIRAGNVYGGNDLNLSRLIPRSILKCFNNEAPQLYSGVGQFKREFMYIDDVVDAYLVVAERGVAGEAYNVGGSGFQTVFDTVNKICKIVGFNGEPKIVDKDFIEIKEQYLDSTKIERLGWSCKHKIDEGLEKTVEWYRTYALDLEQRKKMFFTA